MKKRELFKYIRKICKQFGVNVKFNPHKQFGGLGFYDRKSNEIEIYTRPVNTIIASVAMHELAHALNSKDNKYPIFHLNEYDEIKDPVLKRKFLATAHRAELFTDKRGKELFQYFFRSGQYVPAYDKSKRSKDSLRKYYENWD